MTSKRRVVVTGMGVISPVGIGLKETWQAMLSGKNGIGHITQFDAESFPCSFAGEVDGFDASQYLPEKEARKMDRFMQLGLACGIEAIEDSGIEITEENAEMAGAYIGSGIGGVNTIESTTLLYQERGSRRVSHVLHPDDDY